MGFFDFAKSEDGERAEDERILSDLLGSRHAVKGAVPRSPGSGPHHRAEADSGAVSGGGRFSNTRALSKPVKGAEIERIRNAVRETTESLEERGYTRDSELDHVAKRDISWFLEHQRALGRADRELAMMQESTGDVESEVDFARVSAEQQAEHMMDQDAATQIEAAIAEAAQDAGSVDVNDGMDWGGAFDDAMDGTFGGEGDVP